MIDRFVYVIQPAEKRELSFIFSLIAGTQLQNSGASRWGVRLGTETKLPQDRF